MSIATAIQNAQQKVANAYTAVSNKGGTLPATQNLSNLPSAINSISGGGGGSDNLPTFVSTGISSFTNDTITSIRPYAFYEMSSSHAAVPITSISCANVTQVGDHAFYRCSDLTSLSLPSLQVIGNSAFTNSGILSVSFPNLTTIGSSVFQSCDITQLTIPASTTSIGSSAFSECQELEEVNYNATNATYTSSSDTNYVFRAIGKNKNNLVFNIGSNVESIPDGFLYPYSNSSSYIPNIKTLNIPSNNNITYIGSYAFKYGSYLPTSVSFPNALTLKSNCFENCTNLVSIDLPNVTTIESHCFSHCSSLQSISLPSLISVNSSVSYFVTYCSNLQTISLPNLTTISYNSAFSSFAAQCSSLTSVDFSSLETLTGSSCLQYAFRSCTSLTTLSFPSLTSTSFGSYTNQFHTMLSGVDGCTVHFPSNLQSVIGSWTDVTDGFGGTNTTVLFDLTATT